MPRAQQTQLNIRSSFAHIRANELAKLTGMTTTQVVEDALRGCVPSGGESDKSGLEWNGHMWVIPAHGRVITYEKAEAALEAARNGEGER